MALAVAAGRAAVGSRPKGSVGTPGSWSCKRQRGRSARPSVIVARDKSGVVNGARARAGAGLALQAGRPRRLLGGVSALRPVAAPSAGCSVEPHGQLHQRLADCFPRRRHRIGADCGLLAREDRSGQSHAAAAEEPPLHEERRPVRPRYAHPAGLHRNSKQQLLFDPPTLCSKLNWSRTSQATQRS